jgi:hypothetical protein
MIRGTFYKKVQSGLVLDGAIDVTRQDWSVMVNILRHATACITGKHHEVLACCVARCPFVTTPISTAKIRALGDYAGVTLPEIAPDAPVGVVRDSLARAAEDVEGVFARLFDTMETLRRTTRLADLLRAPG